MSDAVLAILTALLVGLAAGFKLHERSVRPVLDDYDRLLRREARDMIRGRVPHVPVPPPDPPASSDPGIGLRG